MIVAFTSELWQRLQFIPKIDFGLPVLTLLIDKIEANRINFYFHPSDEDTLAIHNTLINERKHYLKLVEDSKQSHQNLLGLPVGWTIDLLLSVDSPYIKLTISNLAGSTGKFVCVNERSAEHLIKTVNY